MYARVATFEGRDRSRTGELIATLREHVEALGARRTLILASRDRADDLSITLFGSSEEMRAAEPAFEQIGDDVPASVRGRRASVQVYEVAVDDVAEGAEAARVTRFEGSPDRIDDGVLFVNEHIVPELRELTGWRGLIVLVDRGTGSTRTVSFWDGPESLAATAERAEGLGRQVAEALGESFTGFAEYDVELHTAPVTA